MMTMSKILVAEPPNIYLEVYEYQWYDILSRLAAWLPQGVANNSLGEWTALIGWPPTFPPPIGWQRRKWGQNYRSAIKTQ